MLLTTLIILNLVGLYLLGAALQMTWYITQVFLVNDTGRLITAESWTFRQLVKSAFLWPYHLPRTLYVACDLTRDVLEHHAKLRADMKAKPGLDFDTWYLQQREDKRQIDRAGKQAPGEYAVRHAESAEDQG